MGSAASKAADDTATDVNQMMNVLESKRNEFLARVKLARGEGAETAKEVQGGRTITRVSDIRVATTSGPSNQLKEALKTFFEAVQGGDEPKAAAVEGAQQLLSVGLDSIFGAREGQGKEKTGFVVLFVNFAFVRVDFLVYAYTAKGTKWGAEANKSGACYVADLAVLSLNDLLSSEIDYLLAQSLTVAPNSSNVDEEFRAIQKLKIQLVESKVLSHLLEKEDLSLEDLAAYADARMKAEAGIKKAYDSLPNYSDPANNSSAVPANPATVDPAQT